jgi:hypothetical protein
MTLAAIKKPGMDSHRVSGYQDELFVHHVHSYFKTETHFSRSWFSPHNDLLFYFPEPTPCLVRVNVLSAHAATILLLRIMNSV